jgi:hypothetical protein
MRGTAMLLSVFFPVNPRIHKARIDVPGRPRNGA